MEIHFFYIHQPKLCVPDDIQNGAREGKRFASNKVTHGDHTQKYFQNIRHNMPIKNK